MRVFYVIHVSDVRIATSLNAIRVLYEPETVHAAHITVRGPYQQRYNVDALSATVRGSVVDLYDVAYFFARNQHTVFLNAYGENLREVWHKPDIPEFSPHLTLYDGADRKKAIELYQLLTRFPIALPFAVGGLQQLVSGSRDDIELRTGLDLDLLANIVGRRLDLDALRNANDRWRAFFTERLCRFLFGLSEAVASHYPQSWERALNAWQRSDRLGLAPGWGITKRAGRSLVSKPAPEPSVPDVSEVPMPPWRSGR